jgi:hypothetical protein
MSIFSRFKKTAKKELQGLSKDELKNELDGLISGANAQGSSLLAKMMLNNLTFKYESSAKFKNSEEQVDSFLDKFPSMVMYRDEIIMKARKFRKANGLEE